MEQTTKARKKVTVTGANATAQATVSVTTSGQAALSDSAKQSGYVMTSLNLVGIMPAVVTAIATAIGYPDEGQQFGIGLGALLGATLSIVKRKKGLL